MQTHRHGIEHIEETTGLSRSYIDKMYLKMKPLLSQHRRKGEQNKVFYDDAAVVIFQRVAQLKRDQMQSPEIAKTILGEYENAIETPRNTVETGVETESKRIENGENTVIASGQASELIATIKAGHKREIELIERSKSEALRLKDGVIEEVRNQMKMLTEGKTPEEFRRERAREDVEREKERQRLAELDQQIEELQSREEARKAKAVERQTLVDELASLEGKWMQGGRRKAIVAKLKQIDHQDGE